MKNRERGYRALASKTLRCAAVGVAAILLLAGCASNDQFALDYGAGGHKNYVAGDGSILEIPPTNRKAPVVFGGVTETGAKVSSSDFLGSVLVVNFWASYCAPCRAEAPMLEGLSQKWADKGAKFLGINTYDGPAQVDAFARNYGVTYSSIIDVHSGAAQLAFAGTVAPSALPTTIVLDKQGRVAARILGQVESSSILDTIIQSVVDGENR